MTIFIKPKTKILYLYSAEDVNLADFIISEGINEGSVTVIIPEGEIIGGTGSENDYALNVGDIRQFEGITLQVDGEIQGYAGLSSGADGGSGIYSVYPITIEVTDSGAIRAGGGAGGGGGKGGAGNNVGSWDYNEYNDGSDSGPDSLWVYADSCYGGSIHKHRWEDHYFCAEGSYPYRIYNGYAYKAGDHKHSAFYAIQRAYINNGSKGAGGTNGVGQGYESEPTIGGAGGGSTNRAGAGGAGGAGGTWGEPGVNGSSGSPGYSYTRSSSSNKANGSAGTTGGQSGHSVYAYEGSQTGVIVINNGTMQGRTYY